MRLSRRTGPRAGRWALVAACGVAALVLGGCGNPGGVDGDLADDWVTVSEPKSFLPPAEVCHESGYTPSASLAAFEPVDCAGPHRAETVHVGAFSGAAAGRPAPPSRTSVEVRAAYADCDQKTRAYLGDDFRHGRLWLGVVVPSASGWKGGARWYRCDVFQVEDVEEFGDPVERRGSLKGALAAGSAAGADLRLGCYQVTAESNGSIGKMNPVACTTRHNSEFVGVYQAPTAAGYPKSDAAWRRIHVGCRKEVARYVRVPDDDELEFRTGTVVVPNLEPDWAAGNHGVRCYLYLKDARFTRSLKGAGPRALPVN